MRSVTHRRVVPDSRSSLIDRACFILEKAWANGLSEPSIEPEVLWDKAAKGSAPTAERNGRDSIDVQDFRERLEKLCSSISEEAELNALGKTIAHGQIVRIIRQRLALGQLWGNRPQILETKLDSTPRCARKIPLFIARSVELPWLINTIPSIPNKGAAP